MWAAEITSTWGIDAKGRNVPQVRLDYGTGAYWRAGQKWQDVTGQPSANLQPDPNLYIVYVECEPDVLDAIEADGRYCVMWCSEIVEDEF